MKILYIGYFSEFNGRKLFCSPAANNVCTYVKDVLLRDNKNEIIVLNIARPKKHLSFFKNSCIKSGNCTFVNAPSYGSGRLLSFLFGWIFNKWIRKFISKNLSKYDCVIFYHSLNTLKLESFVATHFNSILQLEEIYSSLFPKYAKCKSKELATIEIFKKAIIPSDNFSFKRKTIFKTITLYGSYSSNEHVTNQLVQNSIVYAGTISESLGAHFACEVMKFLPDYKLHIYGYGTETEFELIKKKYQNFENIIINHEISQTELEKILPNYVIGINPRPNDFCFDFSAFPSKIMVYLKSGLKIISSPFKSLKESPFSEFISYSKYDAASFAREIRKIEQQKNVKAIEFIKNKDAQFYDELFELIEEEV